MLAEGSFVADFSLIHVAFATQGVRGDERNKTHLAIEISMFTKKEMEWGN